MRNASVRTLLAWSAGAVCSLAIVGAPRPPAAFAGPPAPALPVPKAADVPFKPSSVPGVMVRSIPSASPAGGGRSIILLPGGKLSDIRRPPSGSGQSAPVTFALRGGGVGMMTPPEAMPYATIMVGRDGKPVMNCKPGATRSATPVTACAKPAGKKAGTKSAKRVR